MGFTVLTITIHGLDMRMSATYTSTSHPAWCEVCFWAVPDRALSGIIVMLKLFWVGYGGRLSAKALYLSSW